MASIKTILRAVGELGPRPMILYGIYQVLLRLGWFRWRTPQKTWQDVPFTFWLRPSLPGDPEDYLEIRKRSGKRFFLDPGPEFARALKEIIGQYADEAVEQADAILAGRFRLFGTDNYDLGFPPDWGRFGSAPGDSTSASVALDRHWTAYDEKDYPRDIKLLWEPARFGWVFPLARAYVLTDDARYADAIWHLVDSWRKSNPSNTGPHWISAQEVAIRMLAMIFALQITFPRVSESPEKLCEIAQLIAVHAARIPPTLLYARAQGNNHLLVEAVGLYSVGLLFPEFRKAKVWRRLGRRWLEKSLRHQIFADGGYVQHSTNYHRLALQGALWAARLAQVNGEPLSPASLQVLRHCTRWYTAMIDRECGEVPNMGPNDGALIFPLSTCAFEDHRPTGQAAALVFGEAKPFPSGPWDEELLWFGVGPGVSRDITREQSASRQKKDVEVYRQVVESRDHFSDSGFYLLHGEKAWGLLRCARFRSRPGHSDQLHFDLWWQGNNIACDPGTYLYNGKPPWDNPWGGAAFHNTVLVDDKDPMHRAGRFLWIDWAQGRLLGRWRTQNGEIEVLTGEHYGYRSVIHRRSVARLGENLWLVVDDLLGQGVHNTSIGWTMPDYPWKPMDNGLSLEMGASNIEMKLEGNVGRGGLYRAGVLECGDEVVPDPEVIGWKSIKYGVKAPCLRYVTRSEESLPVRRCTWWQLAGVNKDEVEIEWSDPGQKLTPFSSLKWQGQHLDINDAYSTDPSSFRCAG